MNVPFLIEALKDFTEKAVADFSLPCALQKGDREQIYRAPEVHKMRLPDSTSYEKKAPYIIIRYLKSVDRQKNSRHGDSLATVRFIFVVYGEDEESGSMSLLNVMERVKSELMETVVIGNVFRLDTETGLEATVYTEDTSPYFGGEMIGTFYLPCAERTVNLYEK